jgi:hypothetical protein
VEKFIIFVKVSEGGQERALTINAPPLLSSDFMKNSVLVFNKLSLSTG